MPIPDAQIQPTNAAASPMPAPAPAPAAASAATNAPAAPAGIPETISNDPVVGAILKQEIPGVVATNDSDYPQLNAIAAEAQTLQQMGLGFYVAQDESVAIFNPVVITEQQLKTADQQGKLYDVLPEYGELTGATPQGKNKPSARAAGLIPPTPQGKIPKMPAKAATQTQQARLKNLTPAGPASGFRPGGGRVLNTLAKPTI